MHREDLLIDDGGNRQAVETIGKSLPKLDVITTLALVVETVDTVNGRTFVVSSENKEVFWIFDFIGQKQADGFKRLFTSVNVVAKEKVVGFWGESSVLKQSEKVVILSMDISANLVSKWYYKREGWFKLRNPL